MSKRKNFLLRFALLVLPVFLFGFYLSSKPASATTYNIVTTADDMIDNGNCTLREAIQAANKDAAVDQCAAGQATGDTINLAAGTYTIAAGGTNEDSNANGDFDIEKGILTIKGAGSGSTIIKGVGVAANERVFDVRTTEQVTFQDLQITDSDTDIINEYGSAIRGINSSNINITNVLINNNRQSTIDIGDNSILHVATSTFSNNYGFEGGALRCGFYTDVTVLNSTFDSNGAFYRGGAIYTEQVASLTVMNATFKNNFTDSGDGGAINSTPYLVISDSTFENNRAGNLDSTGGAVFVQDAGGSSPSPTPNIVGSAFTKNSSIQGGGALSISGGRSVTFTIDNSDFIENSVDDQSGGAILNAYNTLVIKNSTFKKNSINGRGGAISYGGSLEISTSLFDGNTATMYSGTLESFSPTQEQNTVKISDSIFVNNDAPQSQITSMEGGLMTIERSYFGNNVGPLTEAGSSSIDLFSSGIAVVTAFPTLNINNSTFYNNTKITTRGMAADALVNIDSSTFTTDRNNLFSVETGTINLKNSILNNSASDPIIKNTGTFTSQGHNISKKSTTFLNQSTDLNGVDPQISTTPVLVNGTYVLPPSSTSPALDSGSTTLTVDQTNGLRPKDSDGNGTATPERGAYELADVVAPILTMVTPIPSLTKDNTPSLVFNTTEAGTITYGGSCASTTATATTGDNTITLDTLADGTYSDCTITITDATGNVSNVLAISTFTVDTTTPVLTEVTPIPNPTTDGTPDYTFNTTEGGTITYGGSCSSATTTAVAGQNTITLNNLPNGTYTDCTITITDAAGNVSNVLKISEFTIEGVTSTPTPTDTVTPTDTTTPTPVPTLPNTGANIVIPAMTGLTVLVGLGLTTGLTLVKNRRSRK